MAITVSGTTITFNDATTQSTAATSVPSTATSVGAIIWAFPAVTIAAPGGVGYYTTTYTTGTTISGSSLAYDTYFTYGGYGSPAPASVSTPFGGGPQIPNSGYATWKNTTGGLVASTVPASGTTVSALTYYYSTGLTGTWRACARSHLLANGYTGKTGTGVFAYWFTNMWQRTA